MIGINDHLIAYKGDILTHNVKYKFIDFGYVT